MNTENQNFLKLLFTNKKNKGFTLIELLVAILMSGIVMVGLGAGMVVILNNNKASAAKIDVKNQLNRAIDYINEDVKAARAANIEQVAGVNTTLTLTLLQDDGTDYTVKYYLQDAANPWLGPKVLVREEDGGTPQVLVDRLTENVISSGDFGCSGTGEVGTDLGLGGFQACVASATASNDSNIYRTRISLFGEILDVEGEKGDSTVLEVNSDITSRSIAPSIDPPVLTFDPRSDLSPTLEWEAIDNATGYEIYKCFTDDPIDNCTPDVLLGSTTTSTIFDDTEADQPTRRACYAGVTLASPLTSRLGEEVCTIISPENPPATVSGLTASDDAIQPVVQWAYDSTAIEYKLYRCTSTSSTSPTCSIDPAVDTPVDTFSTITEADFQENVPWSEAINTNNVPAEGEAFCYAVVATNVRGDSSLSNLDCGKLNAALVVDNNLSIAFTNFDTSQIQPTGVTWNTVPDATRYEIRRCEASSWTDTCDPETEGSVILDDLAANIVPFQYDEIGLPPADSRYCYAVRATNETTASPFSSPECGAGRAPECRINLPELGLGSASSYLSSATETDRQGLINTFNSFTFNGFTFFNPPETLIENSGDGAVLHTVEYESSPGVYESVEDGNDTRTLPCDAQVRFKWFYVPDGSLGVPTLTLTPGNPDDRSNLSWTAVDDANVYRLYRCQANDGETCTPNTNFFSREYNGANLSYSDTDRPNNNPSKRFCYVIEAADTTANPDVIGDPSAPICGNAR